MYHFLIESQAPAGACSKPDAGGCLLVPLARIPKRLRFYEDAAKVVQRRMVPNFKKSFERAVRTARR